MRATEEGVQRGMHILASMTPGGERHLWTVSRVRGKHSIEIISHSGDLLMEATMHTHNINKNPSADSEHPILVNYVEGKWPEIGALEIYELESRDS